MCSEDILRPLGLRDLFGTLPEYTPKLGTVKNDHYMCVRKTAD